MHVRHGWRLLRRNTTASAAPSRPARTASAPSTRRAARTSGTPRCADEAATDCAERCTACAADNCCEARDAPGYNDDPCQACVCNVDQFCCDSLWDSGCVNIAKGDCPDECGCAAATCAGDCDGDGQVAINEIITGVNIALGSTPVGNCAAVETNGDGEVGINELIQAVNSGLNGCTA